MTCKKIICLWFVLLVVFGQNGCVEKQIIQAKVVDESNKPIAGAILYYEVYDAAGVYDFGFAVTDDQGEVPAKDKSRLYTVWHSDSKIALAAFSNDKKPTVLYDQLGNVTPSGMIITLHNITDAKSKWEPRIAKLAFPFEDNVKLYKKLEMPGYRTLLNAFINAYSPLIDGDVTTLGYEKEKINAINKLIKDSSK